MHRNLDGCRHGTFARRQLQSHYSCLEILTSTLIHSRADLVIKTMMFITSSPAFDMAAQKIPGPIQDNVMSPDALAALAAVYSLGQFKWLPNGYGFADGSAYRMSASLAGDLELHGYVEIENGTVTISELGRELLREILEDGCAVPTICPSSPL